MSTELADQLKSAAGNFVVKTVASLAAVFGLGTYFMLAAPFGGQYGIVLTGAAFGLWLVYALVLHSRRDAVAASRPASAPKPSAPAASVAQNTLEPALQWLEGHTEASRKEAAQSRPWYLVLGSTNSGKTTLISGTGMSIQYPAWGNNPAESRKTNGCGVYVTERGVLLDAPGTLLEAAGLHSLLNLLKQVRHLRRREPLNGIVLVVDARRLISLTQDQLGRLGLQYRELLRNVRAAIGRNVPINLAISKCDELPGFSSFFDGLPSAYGRTPAWGFVLSREEREHPDWLKHCDRELRGLYARLVARRTMQLRAVDEGLRDEVVQFPEQFQLLRNHVRTFVEPLCRRTRKSSENPALRGVFFAAALGAEPTGSAVVMTRRFTDSARALIHDVVLANPNTGSASWWQEVRAALDWKTATLACGALLLALVMGFGVYPAFRDNLRLVQATERLQQIPDTAIREKVSALSQLRTALIALGADAHFRASRTSHWTMFAGSGAIESGVRAYEAGAVKAFISNPAGCAQRLESGLANSSDDLTLYRDLKTYLMVTAPGKPRQGESEEQKNRDVAFLSGVESSLARCWTSVAATAGANASDELRFYAHRVVAHQNPALHKPSPDAEGRIRTARDRLAGADPIQAYYDELRGQTSSDVPGVDLSSEAKATALLTASSPNTPIPGLFTRKGWETIARTRIERLVEEYRLERAWVLGLSADSEAVRRQLRERYFADYRNSWMAAIQALRVSSFGSWNTAMEKLLVLGGSQPDSEPSGSAYYRLLKLIADNTWGSAADVSAAPPELAAVANDLKSVHGLVNAAEGKPADIQEYLGAVHAIYIQVSSYQTVSKCDDRVLNGVRDAVLRANEVVAKLRPRIDPSLSNLGVLLQQPVTNVNGLLGGELKQCQAPGPVLPPSPPPGSLNPTVTLHAEPSTIAPGQTSTLEWNSERATMATIDGEAVPPTGSRQVSPTQKTTYTIIVTSANGSQAVATTNVTILATTPAAPSAPEPIFVSGIISQGDKGEKPASGKVLILRKFDTGEATRVAAGLDGSFRFALAIEPAAAYQLCYEDVKASTCSTPAKALRNGDVFRYQVRKLGTLFINADRYTVRIMLGE